MPPNKSCRAISNKDDIKMLQHSASNVTDESSPCLVGANPAQPKKRSVEVIAEPSNHFSELKLLVLSANIFKTIIKIVHTRTLETAASMRFTPIISTPSGTIVPKRS